MKSIITLSIALVFIFSGCTQKQPQYIYLQAPKYDFQKIDLSNTYIEVEKDELNCFRPLKQLNMIYKETVKFYEDQIDEYNIDSEETE